jgi:type II secretory pathway pseudopilin PulG
MKTSIMIAAAIAVTVAAPVLAQRERTERVQFARGAGSKSIAGAIRGDNVVSYIVSARAGQRLTVTLRTSNRSNYFNVWAPGADTALYSQTTGAPFTGALPADGDYRIQVYLMRNAARRNERASYTLNVGLR